jgi:CHRD domain
MSYGLSARGVLSTTAVALVLAGCAVVPPDAHMAAFSTQMTGTNQVPSVKTAGTGKLVAVYDRNTSLFRWKLSFSGLKGAPTAGHFHGPAAIGANAPATLPFTGPVKSPMEGRATLTEAQAADLLAGKWYVSIDTTAHPRGEIRGQIILRE